MEPQVTRQAEYEFSLVLTGMTALSAEIENALFEAGCDDATLSMQSGRACLTFTRSAPSLKDAILAAIRDVQRAQAGLDVLRVEAGLEDDTGREARELAAINSVLAFRHQRKVDPHLTEEILAAADQG